MMHSEINAKKKFEKARIIRKSLTRRCARRLVMRWCGDIRADKLVGV